MGGVGEGCSTYIDIIIGGVKTDTYFYYGVVDSPIKCSYRYYNQWGWTVPLINKFVNDLWQVGSFLRVLQFPPPIKLTATI